MTDFSREELEFRESLASEGIFLFEEEVEKHLGVRDARRATRDLIHPTPNIRPGQQEHAHGAVGVPLGSRLLASMMHAVARALKPHGSPENARSRFRDATSGDVEEILPFDYIRNARSEEEVGKVLDQFEKIFGYRPPQRDLENLSDDEKVLIENLKRAARGASREGDNPETGQVDVNALFQDIEAFYRKTGQEDKATATSRKRQGFLLQRKNAEVGGIQNLETREKDRVIQEAQREASQASQAARRRAEQQAAREAPSIQEAERELDEARQARAEEGTRRLQRETDDRAGRESTPPDEEAAGRRQRIGDAFRGAARRLGIMLPEQAQEELPGPGARPGVPERPAPPPPVQEEQPSLPGPRPRSRAVDARLEEPMLNALGQAALRVRNRVLPKLSDDNPRKQDLEAALNRVTNIASTDSPSKKQFANALAHLFEAQKNYLDWHHQQQEAARTGSRTYNWNSLPEDVLTELKAHEHHTAQFYHAARQFVANFRDPDRPVATPSTPERRERPQEQQMSVASVLREIEDAASAELERGLTNTGKSPSQEAAEATGRATQRIRDEKQKEAASQLLEGIQSFLKGHLKSITEAENNPDPVERARQLRLRRGVDEILQEKARRLEELARRMSTPGEHVNAGDIMRSIAEAIEGAPRDDERIPYTFDDKLRAVVGRNREVWVRDIEAILESASEDERDEAEVVRSLQTQVDARIKELLRRKIKSIRRSYGVDEEKALQIIYNDNRRAFNKAHDLALRELAEDRFEQVKSNKPLTLADLFGRFGTPKPGSAAAHRKTPREREKPASEVARELATLAEMYYEFDTNKARIKAARERAQRNVRERQSAAAAMRTADAQPGEEVDVTPEGSGGKYENLSIRSDADESINALVDEETGQSTERIHATYISALRNLSNGYGGGDEADVLDLLRVYVSGMSSDRVSNEEKKKLHEKVMQALDNQFQNEDIKTAATGPINPRVEAQKIFESALIDGMVFRALQNLSQHEGVDPFVRKFLAAQRSGGEVEFNENEILGLQSLLNSIDVQNTNVEHEVMRGSFSVVDTTAQTVHLEVDGTTAFQIQKALRKLGFTDATVRPAKDIDEGAENETQSGLAFSNYVDSEGNALHGFVATLYGLDDYDLGKLAEQISNELEPIREGGSVGKVSAVRSLGDRVTNVLRYSHGNMFFVKEDKIEELVEALRNNGVTNFSLHRGVGYDPGRKVTRKTETPTISTLELFWYGEPPSAEQIAKAKAIIESYRFPRGTVQGENQKRPGSVQTSEGRPVTLTMSVGQIGGKRQLQNLLLPTGMQNVTSRYVKGMSDGNVPESTVEISIYDAHVQGNSEEANQALEGVLDTLGRLNPHAQTIAIDDRLIWSNPHYVGNESLDALNFRALLTSLESHLSNEKIHYNDAVAWAETIIPRAQLKLRAKIQEFMNKNDNEAAAEAAKLLETLDAIKESLDTKILDLESPTNFSSLVDPDKFKNRRLESAQGPRAFEMIGRKADDIRKKLGNDRSNYDVREYQKLVTLGTNALLKKLEEGGFDVSNPKLKGIVKSTLKEAIGFEVPGSKKVQYLGDEVDNLAYGNTDVTMSSIIKAIVHHPENYREQLGDYLVGKLQRNAHLTKEEEAKIVALARKESNTLTSPARNLVGRQVWVERNGRRVPFEVREVRSEPAYDDEDAGVEGARFITLEDPNEPEYTPKRDEEGNIVTYVPDDTDLETVFIPEEREDGEDDEPAVYGVARLPRGQWVTRPRTKPVMVPNPQKRVVLNLADEEAIEEIFGAQAERFLRKIRELDEEGYQVFGYDPGYRPGGDVRVEDIDELDFHLLNSPSEFLDENVQREKERLMRRQAQWRALMGQKFQAGGRELVVTNDSTRHVEGSYKVEVVAVNAKDPSDEEVVEVDLSSDEIAEYLPRLVRPDMHKLYNASVSDAEVDMAGIKYLRALAASRNPRDVVPSDEGVKTQHDSSVSSVDDIIQRVNAPRPPTRVKEPTDLEKEGLFRNQVVAVRGARHISGEDLEAGLREFFKTWGGNSWVITGGADGVDSIVESVAAEFPHIGAIIYSPKDLTAAEIALYEKNMGLKLRVPKGQKNDWGALLNGRNTWMANAADVAIGFLKEGGKFPPEVSSTQNMLGKAIHGRPGLMGSKTSGNTDAMMGAKHPSFKPYKKSPTISVRLDASGKWKQTDIYNLDLVSDNDLTRDLYYAVSNLEVDLGASDEKAGLAMGDALSGQLGLAHVELPKGKIEPRNQPIGEESRPQLLDPPAGSVRRGTGKNEGIFAYDASSAAWNPQFSNFAQKNKITINGQKYSSEAVYQALKFPHKPELQQAILEADTKGGPKAAKILAHKHKADVRPDWTSGVSIKAMEWVVRAKAAENFSNFRGMLNITNGKSIVEESKFDNFFGAKRQGNELVGRNHLGRAWMKVRRDLFDNPKVVQQVGKPEVSDFKLLGQDIAGADQAGVRLGVEPDPPRPEPTQTSLGPTGVRAAGRSELPKTVPTSETVGRSRSKQKTKATVVTPQDGSGPGVLVDAPHKSAGMFEQVRQRGIADVLLTHIHEDHIEGLGEIAKDVFSRTSQKLNVFVHESTADKLATIASERGFVDDINIHSVKNDDIVTAGGAEFKVLHTPGHSHDSVVYVAYDKEGSPAKLYVGDSLKSKGLPYFVDKAEPQTGTNGLKSSQEDYVRSVRELLKDERIPEGSMIYDGHSLGTVSYSIDSLKRNSQLMGLLAPRPEEKEVRGDEAESAPSAGEESTTVESPVEAEVDFSNIVVDEAAPDQIAASPLDAQPEAAGEEAPVDFMSIADGSSKLPPAAVSEDTPSVKSTSLIEKLEALQELGQQLDDAFRGDAEPDVIEDLQRRLDEAVGELIGEEGIRNQVDAKAEYWKDKRARLVDEISAAEASSKEQVFKTKQLEAIDRLLHAMGYGDRPLDVQQALEAKVQEEATDLKGVLDRVLAAIDAPPREPETIISDINAAFAEVASHISAINEARDKDTLIQAIRNKQAAARRAQELARELALAFDSSARQKLQDLAGEVVALKDKIETEEDFEPAAREEDLKRLRLLSSELSLTYNHLAKLGRDTDLFLENDMMDKANIVFGAENAAEAERIMRNVGMDFTPQGILNRYEGSLDRYLDDNKNASGEAKVLYEHLTSFPAGERAKATEFDLVGSDVSSRFVAQKRYRELKKLLDDRARFDQFADRILDEMDIEGEAREDAKILLKAGAEFDAVMYQFHQPRERGGHYKDSTGAVFFRGTSYADKSSAIRSLINDALRKHAGNKRLSKEDIQRPELFTHFLRAPQGQRSELVEQAKGKAEDILMYLKEGNLGEAETLRSELRDMFRQLSAAKLTYRKLPENLWQEMHSILGAREIVWTENANGITDNDNALRVHAGDNIIRSIDMLERMADEDKKLGEPESPLALFDSKRTYLARAAKGLRIPKKNFMESLRDETVVPRTDLEPGSVGEWISRNYGISWNVARSKFTANEILGLVNYRGLLNEGVLAAQAKALSDEELPAVKRADFMFDSGLRQLIDNGSTGPQDLEALAKEILEQDFVRNHIEEVAEKRAQDATVGRKMDEQARAEAQKEKKQFYYDAVSTRLFQSLIERAEAYLETEPYNFAPGKQKQVLPTNEANVESAQKVVRYGEELGLKTDQEVLLARREAAQEAIIHDIKALEEMAGEPLGSVKPEYDVAPLKRGQPAEGTDLERDLIAEGNSVPYEEARKYPAYQLMNFLEFGLDRQFIEAAKKYRAALVEKTRGGPEAAGGRNLLWDGAALGMDERILLNLEKVKKVMNDPEKFNKVVDALAELSLRDVYGNDRIDGSIPAARAGAAAEVFEGSLVDKAGLFYKENTFDGKTVNVPALKNQKPIAPALFPSAPPTSRYEELVLHLRERARLLASGELSPTDPAQVAAAQDFIAQLLAVEDKDHLATGSIERFGKLKGDHREPPAEGPRLPVPEPEPGPEDLPEELVLLPQDIDPFLAGVQAQLDEENVVVAREIGTDGTGIAGTIEDVVNAQKADDIFNIIDDQEAVNVADFFISEGGATALRQALLESEAEEGRKYLLSSDEALLAIDELAEKMLAEDEERARHLAEYDMQGLIDLVTNHIQEEAKQRAEAGNKYLLEWWDKKTPRQKALESYRNLASRYRVRFVKPELYDQWDRMMAVKLVQDHKKTNTPIKVREEARANVEEWINSDEANKMRELWRRLDVYYGEVVEDAKKAAAFANIEGGAKRSGKYLLDEAEYLNDARKRSPRSKKEVYENARRAKAAEREAERMAREAAYESRGAPKPMSASLRSVFSKIQGFFRLLWELFQGLIQMLGGGGGGGGGLGGLGGGLPTQNAAQNAASTLAQPPPSSSTPPEEPRQGQQTNAARRAFERARAIFERNRVLVGRVRDTRSEIRNAVIPNDLQLDSTTNRGLDSLLNNNFPRSGPLRERFLNRLQTSMSQHLSRLQAAEENIGNTSPSARRERLRAIQLHRRLAQNTLRLISGLRYN